MHRLTHSWERHNLERNNQEAQSANSHYTGTSAAIGAPTNSQTIVGEQIGDNMSLAASVTTLPSAIQDPPDTAPDATKPDDVEQDADNDVAADAAQPDDMEPPESHTTLDEPANRRGFTKMEFLNTEEYEDLFHDVKEKVTLAIRGDVGAAVTANAPDIHQHHYRNAHQQHWQRFQVKLELQKKLYDEDYERGKSLLDKREQALNIHQRKMEEELRTMATQFRTQQAASQALETKYKLRLRTHIKEVYVEHAQVWNTRYDQDVAMATEQHDARTKWITEHHAQHMEAVRREHSYMEDTNRRSQALQSAVDRAQQLQHALEQQQQQVEARTRQMATQAQQLDERIKKFDQRHEAHQATTSFQQDEFAKYIEMETAKAQVNISQQINAWATVEKDKSVTDIRRLFDQQHSASLDHCKSILQSDIDSMEPLARDLMQ